jgi:hypothetical protein
LAQQPFFDRLLPTTLEQAARSTVSKSVKEGLAEGVGVLDEVPVDLIVRREPVDVWRELTLPEVHAAEKLGEPGSAACELGCRRAREFSDVLTRSWDLYIADGGTAPSSLSASVKATARPEGENRTSHSPASGSNVLTRHAGTGRQRASPSVAPIVDRRRRTKFRRPRAWLHSRRPD